MWIEGATLTPTSVGVGCGIDTSDNTVDSGSSISEWDVKSSPNDLHRNVRLSSGVKCGDSRGVLLDVDVDLFLLVTFFVFLVYEYRFSKPIYNLLLQQQQQQLTS